MTICFFPSLFFEGYVWNGGCIKSSPIYKHYSFCCLVKMLLILRWCIGEHENLLLSDLNYQTELLVGWFFLSLDLTIEKKKKKKEQYNFCSTCARLQIWFHFYVVLFSFIRNLMHVGDRRTKAPRLHVLINWLTRFQLRGLGRNRLILYVQWIFFTEEWKGPRKTLMHPYTYIFTFFAVAPTLFFFFSPYESCISWKSR